MSELKKWPFILRLEIVLLLVALPVPAIYRACVGEGWALYHGWPIPDSVGMLSAMIALVVLIISFCGIIGVILRERNHKYWLVYVITFCVAVISIGSNLPAMGTAREKPRRISCASNIKQIYLALQQYAAENNGWFPPQNGAAGLEVLRNGEYLTDYKIYICPSVSEMPGKEPQSLTEKTVSYQYYGGFRRDSPKGSVILRDHDNNHWRYGNVLYADGCIAHLLAKDWQDKIPARP